MKRKKFLKKINECHIVISGRPEVVCFTLNEVFGFERYSHKLPITELYRDLFEPCEEQREYSYFGTTKEPHNNFIRQISLDLFKEHCLRDKEYLDWE